MKVVRTHAEWRNFALQGSVGFVPTMGALHAGHASLLTRMRDECQTRVLSIFVNPLQFGPKEDLARYPRTWEQDLELARTHGVDVVFAPAASEMYPEGFSTHVREELFSQGLCGKFRPGHFEGVATVVLKLFEIVRPARAYFGWKDAQQFLMLSKLVRDLSMPVEMIGVPTLRETDGLAMSSRNRYLSPAERERAGLVYRVLTDTQAGLMDGQEWTTLHAAALKRWRDANIVPQYLELRNLKTWSNETVRSKDGPSLLLAAAVYLGDTRLIDNTVF